MKERFRGGRKLKNVFKNNDDKAAASSEETKEKSKGKSKASKEKKMVKTKSGDKPPEKNSNGEEKVDLDRLEKQLALCESKEGISFIDAEESEAQKEVEEKTKTSDENLKKNVQSGDHRDSVLFQDMYAEQWWDASNRMTEQNELNRKAKAVEQEENILVNGNHELDSRSLASEDDCVSKFYDAPEGENSKVSEHPWVVNGHSSYEDIKVSSSDNGNREKHAEYSSSSMKAREWVKSFNEAVSVNAESIVEEHAKNLKKLIRSCSETELSESKGSWARKDEINLHAKTLQPNLTMTEVIKQANEAEEKEGKSNYASSDLERVELARKESLKKAFGVKTKLGLGPIVDSCSDSFRQTDLYLAFTPAALAATTTSNQPLLAVDSLDDEESNNAQDMNLHGDVKTDSSREVASKNICPSDNNIKKYGNSEATAKPVENGFPKIQLKDETVDDIDMTAASPSNTKNLIENGTILEVTNFENGFPCENVNEKVQEDSIENSQNGDVVVDSVYDLRENRDPRKANVKYISKSIKSFAGSLFNEKQKKETTPDRDAQTDSKKKSKFSGMFNTGSKLVNKLNLTKDKGMIEQEAEVHKLDPSTFPKIIVTESSFEGPSADTIEEAITTEESEVTTSSGSRGGEPFSEDEPAQSTNLPDFEKIAESSGEEDKEICSTIGDDTQCFQSVVDQDDQVDRKLNEVSDDDDATMYFSLSHTGTKKEDSFSADEVDIDLLRKVGIIKTEKDEETLRKLASGESPPSSNGSSSKTLERDVSSEATISVDQSDKCRLNGLPELEISLQIQEKEVNDDNVILQGSSLLCAANQKETCPSPGQKGKLNMKAVDILEEYTEDVLDRKPDIGRQMQLQPIPSHSLPKPCPRTKKNRGVYQTKQEVETSVPASAREKNTSISNSKLTVGSSDTKSSSSNESFENSGSIALRDPDTGEHIYCEIGDDKPTVPKPMPRGRKGKKDPTIYASQSSSEKIKDHGNSDLNYETSSSNYSIRSSQKSVPEWIANRGPMPCPRKQKQNSLQSLPAALAAQQEVRPLPLPSKVTLKGSEPEAWSGEDFYCGKAASIAYGVSSHHPQLSSEDENYPGGFSKEKNGAIPCNLSYLEVDEEIVPSPVKISPAEGVPKDRRHEVQNQQKPARRRRKTNQGGLGTDTDVGCTKSLAKEKVSLYLVSNIFEIHRMK